MWVRALLVWGGWDHEAVNIVDPLWLRVAIASIPILGALIAGVFALTNTINRRVERLKNLLAVRDSLPGSLNPGNAVEQIILLELAAIDFGTTPAIVWLKRASYVSGVLVCISLVLTNLPPAVRSNHSAVAFYETASTFAMLAVSVATLLLVRPVQAKVVLYRNSLRELEKAAAQDMSDRVAEGGKTPSGWLDRAADRVMPGVGRVRLMVGLAWAWSSSLSLWWPRTWDGDRVLTAAPGQSVRRATRCRLRGARSRRPCLSVLGVESQGAHMGQLVDGARSVFEFCCATGVTVPLCRRFGVARARGLADVDGCGPLHGHPANNTRPMLIRCRQYTSNTLRRLESHRMGPHQAGPGRIAHRSRCTTKGE